MKLCKRILPLLLALFLLPLNASAADFVDPGRATMLEITAKYDTLSMEGMVLSLYRVSDMDNTGELTVREDFAPYAAELDIRGENDEAWQTMAQKLQRWVTLNPEIQPIAQAVVEKDGTARLSGLPVGLYLVTARGLEKDGYVYTVSPFFLAFPERDDQDQWNYAVSANAKPAQNPQRMDYRVIKIWEDTCHPEKRPQSITVWLYCDGEPFGEAVTLPENGHWSHTWENLDVNHTWTVVEQEITGYKSEVTAEGTTFLITNTHTHPGTSTTPTTPGKLPQTGQLWWPVPVLLCAGLLCLVIGIIRRRGYQDEKEG